MRPPFVTLALPLPFLIPIILILTLTLLLAPTALARRTTIPASSAAAVAYAYAARSGCHVATSPGKCDPDRCFAAGGRCRQGRGKRVRCFPHVLRHGVEVSGHWSNAGPEECKGCECIEDKPPQPRREGLVTVPVNVPVNVPVKVWGEGGGKVGGKRRRGGGEGEGEKCVIVPTQGYDAKDCFRGGGRCRAVKRVFHPRVVEFCHPHVLDWLRTPVPVRMWGEENAEGKCMGCRYRQKNGTTKKKRGEGFLVEGIELREPESD